MKMMRDIAEKTLAEQPRPMAATPLRLDGDEWGDWMPSENHPLF